jgi:hypothetical protein
VVNATESPKNSPEKEPNKETIPVDLWLQRQRKKSVADRSPKTNRYDHEISPGDGEESNTVAATIASQKSKM